VGDDVPDWNTLAHFLLDVNDTFRKYEIQIPYSPQQIHVGA